MAGVKAGPRREAGPAAFPWGAIRGKFADILGRGRTDVIYLIYKDGEILVETDDLDYVKTYVSENEECSVRDARTGKKVPVE